MNGKKFSNSLSPTYPKMKRISDLIRNVIWMIVLIILFILDNYFQWPTWIFWVLVVILSLTLIGIVWSFFEPTLQYRNWSYEVNEEYLQLSFGIFTKEWVTVPMTKIQSVTTIQGPIMKKFNLYTIKVETIGSSHQIPGLELETALVIRENIAKYAKLKEVDE